MAALNYGTLKSTILAVLGRAPNTVVYDMVTSEVNQRLRLRHMQSTATLTVAASISMSGESITDFLAVESMWLNSTYPRPLKPASESVVKAKYEASKIPTSYAISDGVILLDGTGGSDDIELRYYARQADFSADGDTNDVLTYYPNIYIYGSLFHHARLIRDQDASQFWGADYERAINIARATDAEAEMSGDPAIPYVGTAP